MLASGERCKPTVFAVHEGPGHVLVALNAAGQELYGDHIGRPLREFLTGITPGAFAEYLIMVMDRVFLSEKPERIEIVTATWKMEPWRHDDGRVGGVAVTFERNHYPKDVPTHLALEQMRKMPA